jgi:hypothetical protein
VYFDAELELTAGARKAEQMAKQRRKGREQRGVGYSSGEEAGKDQVTWGE